METWCEPLQDRALLRVSGEDAEHFLDNLITCKTADLAESESAFGALLSPQGKILFDFFLIRKDAGFIIDTDASLGDDLLKRLLFYRLRAKVEIVKIADLNVYSFSGEAPASLMFSIEDPRHAGLGKRGYGQFDKPVSNGCYTALRIGLGIAQGGLDFDYGDAYPHEVLMDQYGGVDFKKGCYVGQEVVSRMQHRGTTKKRLVKITSQTALPATGTSILADGKPAGILGSVRQNDGLAVLRLDRVAKADRIEADGVPLRCNLPDWVNFTWPEAG